MSEHDENFAEMFEASVKPRQFTRGQTIEGTVVGFGQDVAFVEVGGKSEAVIDIADLKDADGDVEVSIGDRIQALVVSTSGGIVLSRKGVRNTASQRELEDAFQAGLAVEGKVDSVVKGGYEVRIARGRAFCPISQIDVVRTDDPAVHVGRVYAFQILEYKEGGKNVVVSRRKHLEALQRASETAVRASIVPGAVLTGTVASVLEFGAFIDLGGGIQGLLHVSEMSWSRSAAPAEIVAVGERINVKVLRVDEGTQKISLGLKQLLDDPWTSVTGKYEIGQVRTGRVTRLAAFGAFVELEPGVEGLAHASTFAPTGRPGGWATSVTAGMTGVFEILSVNAAEKRIGLALVDEGSARAATAVSTGRALAAGAIVTGKVERHESFGVLVFLSPGRTGLIPLSETGVDRGTDLRKAFPIGSEVEVAVLEVEPTGRRIRLSRKAVAEQRERAELQEYTARADAAPRTSLGSLGDNLRDVLKRR